MDGKIIGLLTRNFRIYYDLICALKEIDMPFHSLSFSERVPKNVGVVITTRNELKDIDFPKVVVADIGIQFAIHMAKKLLSDRESFREVVIGIDPGRKPGVAVVGDGMVLHTAQAKSPEDVLEIAEIAVLMYPAETVRVRIGDGSPTERNRIINTLSMLKLPVEIVDEKRTTNKRSRSADTDAAVEIAFSHGVMAERTYAVTPTGGELRDIQRRSRLQSGGDVTISRNLAEKVASGRLTMDRAVEIQKKKRRDAGTSAAGDEG
jgi:hypothetical protein